MANVLILGSSGMLGNAVDKYFRENTKHKIFSTVRNINMLKDRTYSLLDVDISTILYLENYILPQSSGLKLIPDSLLALNDFIDLENIKIDYIINCIGVIKPFMKNNVEKAILLNSYFPRLLSKVCKKEGIKLIHITTDCVYSGFKGDYIETDVHDCTDDYGKTKSLGEPDDCMVIRTSIIGEEIHKFASLISWAKSQEGKEVNGFTNHIWNGITTKQYAKCCKQIIDQDLWKPELFHIFTNDVTKFEMLQQFNKKWNLNLDIKPRKADIAINRALRTNKDLNRKLDIAIFEHMIRDL